MAAKRSLVVITAMQTELDEAVRMDAVDMLEGQKIALTDVAKYLRGAQSALNRIEAARFSIEKNLPLGG